MIDDGFEELLRYDSSVQINRRVLASEVEVAGQTIPGGDLCVVMLGACNRDPEAFAEPDRLDLTRDVSQHNGFGLRAYYCLGSSIDLPLTPERVWQAIQSAGGPVTEITWPVLPR